MGNAPPEGLSPKDDAEAAQWAEEDAQAMRMPRYVPVASLADAPEPHNHVFVENGEYFSAFGHVANEGPVSYHVPTDTWVEGAPGFPVLQQGHANGCGFALAMLP